MWGVGGGYKLEQETFFFFKQEAAYEVLRSSVGSEMGIRGRAGRLGRLESLSGFFIPPPLVALDPRW